MSDLMFNETPVSGSMRNFYKFGDWKLYAVHDDKNIKGFFGDYRWLSNFHQCPIYFEGLVFPSSENAYQAAKVDIDHRHHFQDCTPSKSKKVWKDFHLIDASGEEWDNRKYDIMSVILFDKFYRNKDLRQKLIETGNKFLEETNHWSDLVWGVDFETQMGKNWLGIILMNIRDFWKNKPLEIFYE